MRARAVDENQQTVVKALRALGISVQVLSMVGNGFPDLLVGYQGRNYLVELKDGRKPPSGRKVTPKEKEWANAWQGGPVFVAVDVGGILGFLNWEAQQHG
jgi:hypothetical protein